MTLQLFVCGLLVAHQTPSTKCGPRLWFWNPDPKSGKDNDRELHVVYFIFRPFSSVSRLSCEAMPNLSHCLMTSCSALSFAFQTEKGSALHEAALFGKTDVVQILLAAGERSAVLLSVQHAGVEIAPL